MTGTTNGAGSVCPSGGSGLTPVLSGFVLLDLWFSV